MNPYLPNDPARAWQLLGLLALTLLGGFGITRLQSPRWARRAAWLLAVLAVAGANGLCAQEPAGFRMLAIIGALLFGMKTVVSVEAQADGQPRLSVWRWFAFAVAWFGMRPALFVKVGRRPQPGACSLLWLGVARLLLGLALLLAARFVYPWTPSWLPSNLAHLPSLLLVLPGVSLVLHFGIFNVLAGLWRLAGVDCRPLFRAPLLATSLGEFWGRRWNLGFSEMTAVAVYRPLLGVLGKSGATVAAFLFSGLLHELAISLPVKAGFGLPFLYFVLHGGLVGLERVLGRAGWPVDRVKWLGRGWTLAWLALPLPILFHAPFRDGVLWPLLGLAR
jgi:hypothetical protein